MFVSRRNLENEVLIAKLETESNIQYLEMRLRSETEAMVMKLDAMEKEFNNKLAMLEQKIESLK